MKMDAFLRTWKILKKFITTKVNKWVIQDFLDFKVSRYCEVYSFLGKYLRTLNLKFQKTTSKIEDVLALPCWLLQLN